MKYFVLTVIFLALIAMVLGGYFYLGWQDNSVLEAQMGVEEGVFLSHPDNAVPDLREFDNIRQ